MRIAEISAEIARVKVRETPRRRDLSRPIRPTRLGDRILERRPVVAERGAERRENEGSELIDTVKLIQ